MEKIYFTGIGSRETPLPILNKMREVAYGLCQPRVGVQFVLRSGKAGGADEAFQLGVQYATNEQRNAYDVSIKEVAEIYTPWDRFKNNNVLSLWDYTPKGEQMVNCQRIAASLHPAWDRCSQGAKKLHGRNICQVLGRDLETPSSFVLFYAKEDRQGNVKGGTATAVNLARQHGIPTINMLYSDWEITFDKVLDEIFDKLKVK